MLYCFGLFEGLHGVATAVARRAGGTLQEGTPDGRSASTSRLVEQGPFLQGLGRLCGAAEALSSGRPAVRLALPRQSLQVLATER